MLKRKEISRFATTKLARPIINNSRRSRCWVVIWSSFSREKWSFSRSATHRIGSLLISEYPCQWDVPPLSSFFNDQRSINFHPIKRFYRLKIIINKTMKKISNVTNEWDSSAIFIRNQPCRMVSFLKRSMFRFHLVFALRLCCFYLN